MKHRAIKDLNQLSDNDFYKEISIGLEKIYENCIELDASFKLLTKNENYRASRIIESVSKEEAAKYLILIDSLRCPKKLHKEFTRQLNKFNEHLAKGLYSELCGWRPSSYNDLTSYIENCSEQYFLDGPLGVDWIFRNSIISDREEAYYVDYVDTGDEHRWITPKKHDGLGKMLFTDSSSSVINMVKALHEIGIAEHESIIEFSNYWRTFVFSNNTHYQEFRNANLECFTNIDEKGLLKEHSDTTYSLVINELPFPLYKEDMKEIKISRDDLKKIQDNYHEEY